MTIDLASIALAEQLAEVAGEVIRRYFRQSYLPSATKTEEISAIVTLADREAEAAMVAAIARAMPDDGVIREEGDDIASKNGRYWVLDPIDGTASFVRGLPTFGTLIALVADGIPLIGAIDQPILRERWLGVAGQPTRFNGQDIENPYVRDRSSLLAEACLCSTTPLMFVSEQQQAIARHLQALCRRTAFGGDCFNYACLASGWSAMPMVILESDMNYYDFCALIPVIEGSGGKISDWQGNPLHADGREVLATSSATLHEQAIAAIEAARLG